MSNLRDQQARRALRAYDRAATSTELEDNLRRHLSDRVPESPLAEYSDGLYQIDDPNIPVEHAVTFRVNDGRWRDATGNQELDDDRIEQIEAAIEAGTLVPLIRKERP